MGSYIVKIAGNAVCIFHILEFFDHLMIVYQVCNSDSNSILSFFPFGSVSHQGGREFKMFEMAGYVSRTIACDQALSWDRAKKALGS